MTGTTQALEFNPYLPEVHANPYPLYQRLRTQDLVHRSETGFWVLTRHAEVAAVLRDPRMSRDPRRSAQFQLLRSGDGPDPFEDGALSMLFVDPPDHTRLRTLVNKAFTPAAIGRLRSRVEDLTAQLLDRVADAGELDLVDDLAYPLPVTVICELLGVPAQDQTRFRAWSGALVHLLDPLVATDTLQQALAARTALRSYLGALVAERRTYPAEDLLTALVAAEDQGHRLSEPELVSMCLLLLIAGHETTVNLIANGTLALLTHPAEDLLTALGAAEDQGHRLSDPELVSMCLLLLIAGHETTVNLIANGTLALLTHPAERDRLAADPGLAASAVEELLRYDSPVQLTARHVLADLDIDGRRWARVRRYWPCWGRPTGTRPSSPSRTGSTLPVPPTATSPSGLASTSAWAPPWPAWRPRSP